MRACVLCGVVGQECQCDLLARIDNLTKQRDELLRHLKDCMELFFQVAGGPLDQAARYGPDFEPPTDRDIQDAFARWAKAIAACEEEQT